MAKGKRGLTRETRERLGLTPPDTAFNRRAAEYAKAAVQTANTKKCRAKKKVAKDA